MSTRLWGIEPQIRVSPSPTRGEGVSKQRKHANRQDRL
jgi:hypothetical protein